MNTRLTPDQLQLLNTLIKRHCEYRIGGKCILLGHTCPQSCCTSVICQHILNDLIFTPDFTPLYKQLSEVSEAVTNMKITFKTPTQQKVCPVCGKEFVGYGKSKYCSTECRKTAESEKRRKKNGKEV